MVRTNEKLLFETAALIKAHSSIKAIFFAWPNLKDLTLKLADYMGDSIPASDGGTLFAKCLHEAVISYDETPEELIGTNEQMVRYVRGLLRHANQIVDCHVVSKGGKKESWEPFGGTLASWLEGHQKTEVVRVPYCRVSPASVRLMLLSRIITMRDLQWIEDVNRLITFLDPSERAVAAGNAH